MTFSTIQIASRARLNDDETPGAHRRRHRIGDSLAGGQRWPLALGPVESGGAAEPSEILEQGGFGLTDFMPEAGFVRHRVMSYHLTKSIRL